MHHFRSDTTHCSSQCCNQPKRDVRDQSEDQECYQVCNQSHNYVVVTMRNQRKVRVSQKKYSAREFHMVAEQVMFKGSSRAGINAIRLNVKDVLPQKFKGERGQFKAWANEVMLFLSIEEPRLTGRLKQLQTICQPITDANVISGYTLEQESERFISLSKVILQRL
eukprot:5923996-Amphidinium_carterae.1